MEHLRGPLLEETHYYPFGLTMKGISSKALNGIAENKIRYNGYELNKDFDLNFNETFYRSHDPQLGRFWQIDPKPSDSVSLYAFAYNNPIKYFDPLGDTVGISFLNPGYEHPTLRSEEKDILAKKQNDGVFVLLSHANLYGPGYVDANGNELQAKTPAEMNKLLEATPEWKGAMKEGKEVTLVLLGCNTMSTEKAGTFGGIVTASESIGEKFSKAYPNVTVVGMNGFAVHSIKDGKAQVIGASNHTNDAKIITMKNGKVISETPFNVKFEKSHAVHKTK